MKAPDLSSIRPEVPDAIAQANPNYARTEDPASLIRVESPNIYRALAAMTLLDEYGLAAAATMFDIETGEGSTHTILDASSPDNRTVEERAICLAAILNPRRLIALGGIEQALGIVSATDITGKEGVLLTSTTLPEADVDELKMLGITYMFGGVEYAEVDKHFNEHKRIRQNIDLLVHPERSPEYGIGAGTVMAIAASAFVDFDHVYIPPSVGGPASAAALVAKERWPKADVVEVFVDQSISESREMLGRVMGNTVSRRLVTGPKPPRRSGSFRKSDKSKIRTMRVSPSSVRSAMVKLQENTGQPRDFNASIAKAAADEENHGGRVLVLATGTQMGKEDFVTELENLS